MSHRALERLRPWEFRSRTEDEREVQNHRYQQDRERDTVLRHDGLAAGDPDRERREQRAADGADLVERLLQAEALPHAGRTGGVGDERGARWAPNRLADPLEQEQGDGQLPTRARPGTATRLMR